ncbi:MULTISPECIES: hypothetical protein [Paraburkholderia]|uniref:hypothetical protein n=1 Tax=Paraburkholderia TaxID=1822464 RepID=UPI0038BB7209
MATYNDVQMFVKRRNGIVVQTCWIAHVKELNGLPLRRGRTTERAKPCPPQWRPAIEEAMRHFGWLRGRLDPTLLRRALLEDIEVQLSELIASNYLAGDATVLDEAPAWLVDELAQNRLRLYRDRHGRWILGAFGDA